MNDGTSNEIIDLSNDECDSDQSVENKLVEMGFDRNRVRNILRQCNNDADQALDMLVTAADIDTSTGNPPTFDGACEAQASTSDTSLASVTVCTYNIWFEYPHTYDLRMEALTSVASRGSDTTCSNEEDMPPPSILALQEVTHPQSALLNHHLKPQGWRALTHQHCQQSYWTSMTTRNPCGAVCSAKTQLFACGSNQGRALLYGTISSPIGKVCCGTVHLESFVPQFPAAELVQMRLQQLQESGRVLLDEAKRHGHVLAVLVGDTNWEDSKGDRDGREALEVLGGEWRDVFIDAGCPDKARYTSDGRVNAMLTHSYRLRLDRIFYWISPSRPDISLSAIRLVGKDPIPGQTLTKTVGGRNKSSGVVEVPLVPSDHFGLCASFVGRRAEVEGSLGKRPLVPCVTHSGGSEEEKSEFASAKGQEDEVRAARLRRFQS